MTQASATCHFDTDTNTLVCQGHWRQSELPGLNKIWQTLGLPKGGTVRVEGTGVKFLDTSGAWFLLHQLKNFTVEWLGFSSAHVTLLQLVGEQTVEHAVPERTPVALLEGVGSKALGKFDTGYRFLDFLGALVMHGLGVLRQPKRLRIRPLLAQIEVCGFQALPIVALLSFLIGVVLTYQMGTQLQQYGADVFIVQLLGISVLREFAPLITAIIVIGRTGSAFTAQIGIMKINQEIDALQTIGVTSFDMLIIPRLMGLMIVLPLLIVWADFFGMLGGALMSKAIFDMSVLDFFQRLREDVDLNSYLIGLSKAPVFATLIALVGCFRGLQVSGSAQSVGHHTTRSVVQAIFLIIIADAGFSILYSWAGL